MPQPESQVLLVAAPRSGAGLVQSLWLADARWARSGLSLSDPLDDLLDVHADASSDDRDWSHRLTAADATSEPLRRLQGAAKADRPWRVDWAPRNALRLPLLVAALPDVRIVHVVRDPRTAVPSAVQAWRSGRFVSEPGLPGWWGEPWSFPLVPGWRDLAGKPLHEVVAVQWLTIEKIMSEDLAEIGVPQALVTYEALVADPAREMARLAEELELPWAGTIPEPLPASPWTLTAPDPRKWQRDAHETLAAFAEQQELHAGFLDWSDSVGTPEYRKPLMIEPIPVLAGQVTRSSEDTPFKSAHTSSFVELLDKSGSSVVITTYKSGHLIFARTRGEVLDTHLFSFDRPMGIATAGPRLAIGTGQTIDTFTNQPGLAPALLTAGEDEPRHDGVYVPRSVIFTGDISIHEMAYDADGLLWFVNTKFSCLCTQDIDHSFRVAWVPPWISGLAADDRCHLNGMAMMGGRPRFLTALARTDTPGGWREHKGTSGVVLDLATNEVIAEGLSMPHSPRWHDNRLWVLQSGTGTLSTIDPKTGSVTVVAQLPGFTRGLAFVGPYALIGLSQVRESVFTGLPITQSAAERNCGVWVVDTVSGSTVGLLKFEGAVQEIFDVAVLAGVRWPTLLPKSDTSANGFVLSADDRARIVTHASRSVDAPTET